MYALYTTLLTIWLLAMAPVLLYNAVRHKKHLPKLRQRMGRLPESLRADGRPTLWIHACSVGETLSVQGLAAALHERFPGARLIFSTITASGNAIAHERYEKLYGPGNVFFFPVDLPGVAGNVLDFIQPSALIIVDTEIWPNVVHQAKLRNIPVVMVNGRIAAKSFRQYLWAQPMLARVLGEYAALLMKSPEDAARIQRLGAPPSKIAMSGNLKYDQTPADAALVAEKAKGLNAALELSRWKGQLIVAGSTHEGEDIVLLRALRALREDPTLANTRLLIVPRHAERFDSVAALAEREGFTVRRRSRPGEASAGAEVLLLDTYGELAAAYQFAAVAFVGGTLVPVGGHSIMEPAQFAKPIVIGPHMENFPQIVDEFLEKGAAIQITALESDAATQERDLTEALRSIFADPEKQAKMGAAARSILEDNQGATAFTLERIAGVVRIPIPPPK
ncbi:3-deoxy-D-manno-octulosonic acid transferase [Capsulimonas corticalis]|uniref:3-deoxy-D-manno-octulosonic acid transferase n=1 Tax=Capsulimonas corticalis TaxID=2219043 RepID=A0A402D0Z4_9BACT|nr:3-deoxy-D-manno-octulosonic acid transferase [Capsulimonas corticalis]BDI31730.1 3-deoxy-D-manno-octulosonic acid transferase [Capsulimonas corticalis]